MSVSIDGKIHRGIITVKYGENFPVANRSIKLNNADYGLVLVYIISLGQPKWTNRLSVEIPMRYYITDIIKPSERYIKRKTKKKTNLKVIE